MSYADDLAIWIGGLVFAGLLAHFVIHQFSRETRASRYRRRNYGKVINKTRRPCVTLTVRTPSR